LDTVDGALHDRVKALHPEACAIDAAKRQCVDHCTRQRARVDFNRDLDRGRHKEAMPDRSHQVGKLLRRQKGRGTTTEMNLPDLEAAIDQPHDLLDLTAQPRPVNGDGFVAAGDRGVAAAIPTHRSAERYMQIE
jgi:hypothetical protein